MNNKNKVSVSPWIFRLFNQSEASLPTTHGKAYYAHRYHGYASHTISPFSELFSGADNNLPEIPVTANYVECLEPNFPVSGSRLETSQILNSILPETIGHKTKGSIGPRLTVVNSYAETADTKTFCLVDEGRIFAYLPGQYITLSITINGLAYKRSYSLASSPSRPRTLEITVKRAPNGGIVSNWLNDNLQVGDTLAVNGPFGKFSCIPHSPQKILFIAAGSGIVPIMSMLRWLADTEARVDVQLLLSFRAPKDIIYWDELQLLVAQHKNINMTITLTANELNKMHWAGLKGRIHKKMIRQLIPDLTERMVYLCGPDGFMEKCKKSLMKLLVPAENIVCESFKVDSPKQNPETLHLHQPTRNPTGIYEVRFAKSGKTVTANGQISLLELAEMSGIFIDHECRSGNCGECMVKCLQGQVEMTDQAEIDEIQRKKGWVYSCCAYPTSNLVMEM